MLIPTAIVIVQELDVTWAQMEFDHNPHSSTGVKMIGASEELIETLEDNQVETACLNLQCHEDLPPAVTYHHYSTKVSILKIVKD